MIPRNPCTEMVLPDGTSVTCRLINLSLSGAGVASNTKPPVGTPVWLGQIHGHVVRADEDSFSVEFTRLQRPDFLEQNITQSRARGSVLTEA
jgi:hypothetical protein